ncbi:MAG: Ldh family oxidoreductase [Desulfovibrio sp.]|nr:Ldh family oxidoreductase [Desulfovibrio sp.]
MLLSYDQMRELGLTAFRAAGASEDTAACVTDALLLAELDGMPSHGYSRIPFYVAQAKTGKVKAQATPTVSHPLPAMTVVDAACGYAFPAIGAGLAAAIPRAGQYGIAYVGVRNSHHCGMLGHYAERIAGAGLIGMAFSNSPAAMAPWGGCKASFGTNPIAFGCPVRGGDPIVVDMSLSKVARGKIMNAKQKGERSIPEGWALDADGRPTTDPEEALKGTMIPLGDAKGAALALMVEILAASLTGAHHAFEASSFFEAEGPSPAIGQSFILIAPEAVNPGFPASLARLVEHITDQPGTRLPGARRYALRAQRRRDGLELPDALYEKILACSR